MPEKCSICGEVAMYLTSDRKRKLCINCKHEEAVNEIAEGLLKKRIRKMQNTILSRHVNGNWVCSVLDEVVRDFPKVHQNYWKDGKLITYEDTIQQWKKWWFGDTEK